MDALSLHLLFLTVAGGLFWLCAALWRKRVLLRLIGVPAAAPMLALFIIYLLDANADSLPYWQIVYVYMAVLSLFCVLVQEMLID